MIRSVVDSPIFYQTGSSYPQRKENNSFIYVVSGSPNFLGFNQELNSV
jgi:hypothetical protein